MKPSHPVTLATAVASVVLSFAACSSDSDDGATGASTSQGGSGSGSGGTAAQGGDGQGASSQGGSNAGGAGGEPTSSQGGAEVGGASDGGAGNFGGEGDGGAGGDGSMDCLTCAEYITVCVRDPFDPQCTRDFCNGSDAIFDTLAECVCTDCATECEQTCAGQGSDLDCAACQQASIADTCSLEFADCANDV